MKKTTPDYLFDPKFKDRISKDSLSGLKSGNQEPQRKLAWLIGYVLKLKRNEFQLDSRLDFEDIREQSLELFRENKTGAFRIMNIRKVAVAASILILVGLGGYMIGKSGITAVSEQQAQVIEFNTPKGQQSELTLPDGTFVALNYDSKLKYHLGNNKSLLEVELEGEAFFQVTKNKSRTFRVITRDMSVNVLGTQFDVRAYANDLHTETTLLEGSIEIKDIPDQEKSVLLKPGQKWLYNRNDHQQQLVSVDPQLSTLWRNGEYYFEKVRLGELAKTLERMYNVSIHFQDSGLEDEMYSGSVYQSDEIGKLFEIIGLTIPIHVRTDGRDIWLANK
ncbi:FecR family protein [Gaoshiqia sediminis]|uniref:FecR domain-containing protein n=1 Tax=Gaoshiqia sediminis TaxID=2986998 RepID=A0AA41Y8E6_9BACT|nr:FecR domain-containing protein [Gaoshiqia sediminis]MCW0483082.1 FecR domain-containing protein [Gaoshiqia sediminis]